MNPGRFRTLPREKIAFIFCVGLLSFLMVRELESLFWGVFNVDEFENLQVIWLWEKGIFPFRDYRHSHFPVYNLLLYPVYVLAGPSAHLPGLVRLFFSPLVLLTLLMLGYLGFLVTRNRLGGILSVIFFLSSPCYAERIVEMRPDLFAFPLTLGSIILLLEYMKRRKNGGALFLLSAFFSGLTLLFSLKGVCVILLVLFFFEHYHFHVLRLSFPARLGRTLTFCLLLFAPFFLMLVLLIAADFLRAPDFRILSTSGLKVMTTPWTQAYKEQVWKGFLLANAVIVAWTLFAGWKLWVRRGPPPIPAVRFVTVVAGILFVQILVQPVLFPHFLVLPLMFLSVLAALGLVTCRPGSIIFWSLLAVLIGHALDPSTSDSSRTTQMEAYRYVLSHTDENQPVLDGVSGLGTFRPIEGTFLYYRPHHFHEDFFFDQQLAVARALQARTYGAVIDDPAVRASPEWIRRLIEANYRVSENPLIWLPKQERNAGGSTDQR